MAQGDLQEVPKTLFWGERGLVSTLFLDLAAAGDFGLWNQFLGRFAPPIHGELADAFTIVEPTLGVRAFGSPDAISRLGFASDKIVLITEAKREPYLQASWPRAQRGVDGFNSKINGQLELNYRLSLALSDFFAEVPGNAGLIEPAWLAGTPYSAADPDLPRYVQNRAVLAQVAAQFSGLTPDRYHHLVITTDPTNPFDFPALQMRFPQFFDRLGEDTWNTVRDQVHWINWASISRLLGGGDAPGAGLPRAPRPPRWFTESFALNRSNFRQPPEQQPVAGEAGRPGRGVLMVRLNAQYAEQNGFPVPPDTFVHFSWRGAKAVLRNYFHIPSTSVQTAATPVFANIVHEIPVPERQPHTQEQWWHEMTLALNVQYPAADVL